MKTLHELTTAFLEESNAKFNALPKMTQRVKICEDAILQLKLGKYRATPGEYFSLVETTNSQQEDAFRAEPDAQKALALPITCNVCARGAIFASRCRLGNNVRNPIEYYNYRFHSEEANAIDPIFGQELKSMIEYLFELGIVGYCPKEYKDVAKRWIDQQKQVDSARIYAERRMILILKNIIRNKGKLVLYHKTIE